MHPEDTLHNAAMRFYQKHDGEHLSADRKNLIERCTAHLAEVFSISNLRAEDTALRAFGEHESRGGKGCYVDLDRSTAHVVFVHDPASGIRRVFTIADLVAMIPEWQIRKDAERLTAAA